MSNLAPLIKSILSLLLDTGGDEVGGAQDVLALPFHGAIEFISNLLRARFRSGVPLLPRFFVPVERVVLDCWLYSLCIIWVQLCSSLTAASERMLQICNSFTFRAFLSSFLVVV